jgi:hypothetical protein
MDAVVKPTMPQREWWDALARKGTVSFGRGPMLVVDDAGLHLSGKATLDLSWDEIGDVYAIKPFAFSKGTLVVEVVPDGSVQVDKLKVPVPELAHWIDTLVDQRATIPTHLALWPEEVEKSPLIGFPARRYVDLDRLPLTWDLKSDLTSWGARANEPFDLHLGLESDPVWDRLKAEGEELAERLREELGSGFTVEWLEDVDEGDHPNTP